MKSIVLLLGVFLVFGELLNYLLVKSKEKLNAYICEYRIQCVNIYKRIGKCG